MLSCSVMLPPMNILPLLIITQIILESLPISSSAHVNALERILRSWEHLAPPRTEALDHILHIPTLFIIGAVLIMVHYEIIKKGWRAIVQPEGRVHRVRILWKTKWRTFAVVWGATCITLLLYYLKIPQRVYGCIPEQWAVPVGFMVTAELFLVASRRRLLPTQERRNFGRLPATHSDVPAQAGIHTSSPFLFTLSLGIAQGFALVPGISRFGATLCASLLCGVRPRRAVTLSLLLQFVLMGGATIRALLTPVGRSTLAFLLTPIMLLSVVLASYVAGVLLLYVYRLAQRRKLYYVAYYLMVAAVVSTLL